MPITYNKVDVAIHLDRLRDNFRLLTQRAADPVPVIKSDAYGHGLEPVAAMLAAEGADMMAVGTVGEAVTLRKTGYEGRIIALLGAQDESEAQDVVRHSLIPFVFSLEQLKLLSTVAGTSAVVAVTLKFDTGMARLGFSEHDVPQIVEHLRAMDNLRIDMVASHLAVADDPAQEDFTFTQHETFSRIVNALREAGFSFRATLANSAGVLAYPDLHFDVQRPGIAMYGASPLAGTSYAHMGEGLLPAMEVSVPVLQVREVKKGQSISYGRTFIAPQDMRVAITAAGYADAYSRGLSNVGAMNINGQRAGIVGRVCMQMTAVDVTHISGVEPGQRAWLLGGEGDAAITPEELAGWWNTITYEVFCVLGLNPRRYI